MPIALTGNSIVSLRGGLDIYSIMGIGGKRNWNDVINKVYMLNLKSGKWTEVKPVPGVAGRLGASAIVAKGKIYLFGGFTVDGHDSEYIVSDVNAFLPGEGRWFRGADIPTPVAGAVVGVDHDRYIYLIGGGAKTGPVNNAQVYDVQENTWSQATPFPGTPVYGASGALDDGTIVYVDGAKKNSNGGSVYVSSDECWMGKIDRKDPNKIEWSKLPAHPGPARFGIVTGLVGHKILFIGGTTIPHNFKGLDADGKPAPLSPFTFEFDLHGNKWATITEDTEDVRADVQGIASTPIGLLSFGGTLSNQALSARVLVVSKK
jgi:N-acetylneuraminic acid mutarotase